MYFKVTKKPRIQLENWQILVGVALVLGVGLRLVFPTEFEYKDDERNLVTLTKDARETGTLPWLGMPSSAGTRNPGVTVWPFAAFSVLTGVSPFGLTQAVRVMNCISFFLFFLFCLRFLKNSHERETWGWAALLAATNPFEVFMQRKLWAPSILPTFSLLLWMSWMKRSSRLGAFGVGFLCLFMAQLHMAGLFVAAVLFAWAWWVDRKGKGACKVRWILLGASLAGLPLIPWFLDLGSGSSNPDHILGLGWFERWITVSHGLGIKYFLGSVPISLTFGLAQVVCALVAVLTVVTWIKRLMRRQGPRSETERLIYVSFFGVGLLLTPTLLPIGHHYFLAVFPLTHLWVAMNLLELRQGRRTLGALVFAFLVLTIGILWMIHSNPGAQIGTFGIIPPQI